MASIPEKPNYRFAYFLVYLMYSISILIFSAAVFLTGLLLSGPVLDRDITTFVYDYGLYMIYFIITNIAILAAAQITKAVLDTAVFTWHTMHIYNLTHQNNANCLDKELCEASSNAEEKIGPCV